MSEYRVEFKTPGMAGSPLFETTVGAVENAQDARLVAIGKLKRAQGQAQPVRGLWIEVFELPDEVLVMRMPAEGPCIGAPSA